MWDVLGDHSMISRSVWFQDAGVLEPLQKGEFDKSQFRDYVNLTLEARQPGLVVIESHPEVWVGANALYQDNGNAKLQKREK